MTFGFRLFVILTMLQCSRTQIYRDRNSAHPITHRMVLKEQFKEHILFFLLTSFVFESIISTKEVDSNEHHDRS